MSYSLDIIVASPSWTKKRIKSFIRKVVTKTLEMLDVPDGTELCIKLSSNKEITELNKTYRYKNAPTNVLSFPALKSAHQSSLGDIILAFETIETEAISHKKKFEHHLAHLIVHGVLHLLGYDHGQESDAHIMETLENKVLQSFTIKDPYIHYE